MEFNLSFWAKRWREGRTGRQRTGGASRSSSSSQNDITKESGATLSERIRFCARSVVVSRLDVDVVIDVA